MQKLFTKAVPDIGDRISIKIDYTTILVVILLIAAGIHTLYTLSQSAGGSESHYESQLYFLIPGLAILIALYIFNYRKLNSWFVFVLAYFVAIILLVITLFMPEVHGAKAWIIISGSIRFQPAEFTKILIIIVEAILLARLKDKIQKLQYLFLALLIPGLPLLLVLLQKDAGTAIVILGVSLVQLFIAGVRATHILSLLGTGFLAFFIAIIPILHSHIDDQDSIRSNVVGFFDLTSTNVCYTESENKQLVKMFPKAESSLSSIATLNENKEICYQRSTIENAPPDISKKLKDKLLGTIERNYYLGILEFLGFVFAAGILLFWSYFLTKLKILKYSTIVTLVLILGVTAGSVLQQGLGTHHLARIEAWLYHDVELDKKRDIIFNKKHISDGGLSGAKENDVARMVKPRKTDYNDYIATQFLRHWGFQGSLFLILIFGALLLRSGIISFRAGSHFGSLIASGIFAMFALHIIINLGMILDLLPIIGIPLPFFSRGGSFLIAVMAAIGLLLSIDSRKNILTSK